jgi:hypothetical protein
MDFSESTTRMFEVLDATEDDLIAVRVENGSPAGYEEFYSLLIERTNQYGSVVVYEEVPDWTLGTYLTHLHGIIPDIQLGPDFDISHYACVGDSRWTKLLYHQWRAIKPVWPVAPDIMRYYHLTNRDDALQWVREAAGHR